MGIEICCLNQIKEPGRPDHRDHLLSVPDFFFVAALLSSMAEALRTEPEDSDQKEAREGFFVYLNKDREESEKRFKAYCEFTARSNAVLERQFGIVKDLVTGQPLIKPHIEDFDPDVRAFLGRLILDREPRGKAQAVETILAMLWPGGLAHSFALDRLASEPKTAEKFEFVYNLFTKISEYFQNAFADDDQFQIFY